MTEERRHTRAIDIAEMQPPGVWSVGTVVHHTERIVDDLNSRFTARIADLQGQIDRRIETQIREAEQLRSMLSNEIKALDERVKTVFLEQRHQQLTAEQEREKAASELRLAMTRLIEEGDANLERHVTAQFKSVEAALIAVEKLSEEKDKRIEALHMASESAVDKALTAQKELAEKHNDLIRSAERKEATYATKDEISQVRATAHEQSRIFANAEVVNAELKAIQSEVERLRARDDQNSGRASALTRQQDRIQPWQLALFTLLMSAVSAIVVALILGT